MRGTVAKQLRRLLFSLQVKKQVPKDTEWHVVSHRGTTRCFGARAAYLGMKRQYKEWHGFTPPPEPMLPRAARVELARKERRERKQLSRLKRAFRLAAERETRAKEIQ